MYIPLWIQIVTIILVGILSTLVDVSYKKGHYKIGKYCSTLGVCIALVYLIHGEEIIVELGIAEPSGLYKVMLSENADTEHFQELYDIVEYEDGVYYIRIKERTS